MHQEEERRNREVKVGCRGKVGHGAFVYRDCRRFDSGIYLALFIFGQLRGDRGAMYYNSRFTGAVHLNDLIGASTIHNQSLLL
jgi:hypothetical protein